MDYLLHNHQSIFFWVMNGYIRTVFSIWKNLLFEIIREIIHNWKRNGIRNRSSDTSISCYLLPWRMKQESLFSSYGKDYNTHSHACTVLQTNTKSSRFPNSWITSFSRCIREGVFSSGFKNITGLLFIGLIQKSKYGFSGTHPFFNAVFKSLSLTFRSDISAAMMKSSTKNSNAAVWCSIWKAYLAKK